MSERSNGMQRREKRALVRMVRRAPAASRPKGFRADVLARLGGRPVLATETARALARALRSTGDGVRGLR